MKKAGESELGFLRCLLALKASKNSSASAAAAERANIGSSSSSSRSSSSGVIGVQNCIKSLNEIIRYLGEADKEAYLDQYFELKCDKILLSIIVKKSSDDEEVELALKIMHQIFRSCSTEEHAHMISSNLIVKVFNLLKRRSAKRIHDASCALLSVMRHHVDPHLAFDLLAMSSLASKQSAFTILVNHVTNIGFVNRKLLNVNNSDWEERVLPQLIRALLRPDAVQYSSAELVIRIILAYNEECQATELGPTSSTLCIRICTYLSSLLVCSMSAAGNALLSDNSYGYHDINGEVHMQTDPSNVSLYIIERILHAIEEDQNQSIPRINVNAICYCMRTSNMHYAVFSRLLSYLKKAHSNTGKANNECSVESMWTTALKVAKHLSSDPPDLLSPDPLDPFASAKTRPFLDTAGVGEIIDDSIKAEQKEMNDKINTLLTRWMNLDEIALSDFMEILIGHQVSPIAIFMKDDCLDFDQVCQFIIKPLDSFGDGGIGSMLHISLDGLINPSKLIALIKELLGVCLDNEKVNLDQIFDGRKYSTSTQKSVGSSRIYDFSKGKGRGRKKNESSDVSYKSLTDAVIRIFETGQTSGNDQSLLDAANKRVIQELYDGNVHLMSMAMKQQKGSNSTLASEGRRASIRSEHTSRSDLSQQRKEKKNSLPPTIDDTIDVVTIGLADGTDHSHPEMNSVFHNEFEIAELDHQFRTEFCSTAIEPKRPVAKPTDRNRASVNIRSKSYKSK